MATVSAELALQLAQFGQQIQTAQNMMRGLGSRAAAEGRGMSSSLFGGVMKGVAGLGVALGGLAAGAGVMAGVKKGLDFNSELSNAEAGMANVLGKFLELDKVAAKKEAASAMQKIVELEPKTAGGLADLVGGFMATSAAALSAGVSVDQNIDLVGKFANALANASMPAEQLSQELRSIMSGNITADSALAKVLDISNEDVNKAKEVGNLYEMLNGKIGQLGEAGESPAVVFSTLESAVSKMLGQLTKPVFAEMVAGAKELTSQLESPAVQGFAAGIASGLKNAFGFVRALMQEMNPTGIFRVAGDVLRLGFEEAVNGLWAGLWGTVRATGQGFLETGRVLVASVGLLTRPEFWAGMGNALLAMALQFNAAMMRGIANVLAEVKKIPGVGSLVGNSDRSTRQYADALEGEAARRGSRVDFGPLLDVLGGEMLRSLDNLAEAFKAGAAESEGLYDTKELRQQLGDLVAQIRARQEANDAAANKEEESTGGGGPKKGKEEAAPQTARVGGIFSQAVNLIMGRSPGELQLDEAKKQTGLLQQIEANTKKPAAAPQVTVSKAQPVDMTPRFA